MPFPRFIRRLFANEGAGPKLRVDILPDTLPGNAATATKLATARAIRTNLTNTSTASFDGSSDISPGVTGILPIANGGTGSATGLAATATKLATARYIFGMTFDGTANVSRYASCTTAADTAAKAVALAGFKLEAGSEVLVSFTATNTASAPTLNVQSTGAKPIRFANMAIGAGVPVAGRLYHLVYDGMAWQIVGDVFTPAVTAQIERAEFLNKLSIGAPKFHRSTMLPDDHAWPDGSFVEFEDWPEFGEVYEQGGFTGLVMPWDADAEYQAGHLGMFRPNSANPTGLYLPLHGGQFFRAWALGADGTAGAWGSDAVRNIVGKIGAIPYDVSISGTSNVFYGNGAAAGWQGGPYGFKAVYMDISHDVPTGPQNVPQHIWQPVVIYLGRAAQV